MNKCNLAIALLVLFASCKKDKSADTPPNAANRVKTYTEDITSPTIGNSTTTFNLAYDGNGRVISSTASTPPERTFLLSYPGNGYSLDIINGGAVEIHEDLFYTPAFYLDSTFQYNDTNDTTTEKYIYNGDNQLIQSKEYEYSKLTGGVLYNTITYNYDGSGDMILSTGTDTNADSYEYYSDLLYVYPTISATDAINTRKHHLIKSHTSTSNGFALGTAVYTYTFDSQDRMITEKGVVDDGTVVLKTYTYF